MVDLLAHSRNVILKYQQPSGAYPACPMMLDYQFSWFRDGSYIAHAMLLVGEISSAVAFHKWCANTIRRYESGAKRAMATWQAGAAPNPHDVLRARYTYDGDKGPDEWPEFQLDGLGTWLWSLEHYWKAGHTISEEILSVASFVSDYLSVLWTSPCHDLWEEAGDAIHTHTLSAIAGGLRSASRFLNRPELMANATTIDHYLLENLTCDGRFVKSNLKTIVDASLVGLATPYQSIAHDNALMQATITTIERDLVADGIGVHRYRGDTYYAAGAWLLLGAWMGWYYCECGNTEQAQKILKYIEAHALPNGDLPEQVVPPMLAEASYYSYWVELRGTIATPLLWSHAMYLILAHAISHPL